MAAGSVPVMLAVGATIPGLDMPQFALLLCLTRQSLFERRPDWALAEIGLLWASIVLLAVVLGRHAPRVRWLLAPYLAWVSFASVLNAAIVRLNAPFG